MPPDFDGLIIRRDHCRDYEVSGTALGNWKSSTCLSELTCYGKCNRKQNRAGGQ